MKIITFGTTKILGMFGDDSFIESIHSVNNNYLSDTHSSLETTCLLKNILELETANISKNYPENYKISKLILNDIYDIKYCIVEILGNEPSDNINNMINFINEKLDTSIIIVSDEKIEHLNIKNTHFISNGFSLDKIETFIINKEVDNVIFYMNNIGVYRTNIISFFNKNERNAYNELKNVCNNMEKKYKTSTSLENWRSTYDTIYGKSILQNPEHFQMFETISFNKFILNVAKKYLENENIYLSNILLGINYFSGTERNGSQRWHRDPGINKIIKSFIFFNNTSRDNGAFEYIPQTQKKCLNKISNLYNYDDIYDGIYPDNIKKSGIFHGYNFTTKSQKFFNYNKNEYDEFLKLSTENGLPIVCNEGDIMFVDTSGFHRAGQILKENLTRKYLHTLYITNEMIEQSKEINCGDAIHRGTNLNINIVRDENKKYFYIPEST